MPINNEEELGYRNLMQTGFSSSVLGEHDWPIKEPDLVNKMTQVGSMLGMMIQWCDTPGVPNALLDATNLILGRFKDIGGQMVRVRVDPNQPLGPILNEVRSEVQSFLIRALTPYKRPSDQQDEKNFLPTFGALSAFELSKGGVTETISPEVLATIQNAKTYAEEARKEREEAHRLVESALSQEGAKATSDLGKFYSGESGAHSRWFKEPFPFFGGAQLWLFLGVASLIVLTWVILSLTSTSEVPTAKSSASRNAPTITAPDTMERKFTASGDSTKVKGAGAWTEPSFVIEMIHNLLIISILIFLTRFCFRQFSVRMHLRTLNQRRAILANTLEGFLKSARAEEAELRQAIVLEVVKSMATADATGYVDSNTPEISFPVLTEPIRAAREVHS